MKRIVLLFLAAVLCLLSLAACKKAPEAVLEYTMGHDGTYLILSGAKNVKGQIAIPDSYEGYPVREIGDAVFAQCKQLTRVEIPSSVTAIGNNAFSGCERLEAIELPLGVMSIGWQAFMGCTALKSITVPAGVTALENHAFGGCTALEQVQFPEGSALLQIQTGAFAQCTALQSLVLPSTVEAMANSAFAGCVALEELSFGEGSRLYSVGQSAFEGCDKLIETENGLSYVAGFVIASDPYATEIPWRADTVGIADGAFSKSRYLTEVEIPATVRGIGSSAFAGCVNLEKLTFAEDGSLTYIGQGAFGCRITELTIPATVETIDAEAFRGCDKLRQVTFAQTTGWTAAPVYTEGEAIALELDIPTVNDDYLTATYSAYCWSRK